jgi:hypothetical protein
MVLIHGLVPARQVFSSLSHASSPEHMISEEQHEKHINIMLLKYMLP